MARGCENNKERVSRTLCPWILTSRRKQQSRSQQSVRQSRRENTIRRLPARRPIVWADRTCGTSLAGHRKGRTTPFPDRAPDRARRSQIPRSSLPPPDLRRALPFSRRRETPPTTAESNLAPALEYGAPFAGPSFRGQRAPAAIGPHPVD